MPSMRSWTTANPTSSTKSRRPSRRRIAGREVHLVLENDRNEARRLARRNGQPLRATAQWNDDLHHALHVLVTGETAGFYADYADAAGAPSRPRAGRGLRLSGRAASPFRGGKPPRRSHRRRLPATAFVSFMQNHDQVGNHPFGSRLSARASEPLSACGGSDRAALAADPAAVHGRGMGERSALPLFLRFRAGSCRGGARGPAARVRPFPRISPTRPARRIPDPTAPSTFAMSRLDWSESQEAITALARTLPASSCPPRDRNRARLGDIPPGAGSYRVLGPYAATVEWQFADGARLMLLANFSKDALPPPAAAQSGRLIYASAAVGTPESAAFFAASRRRLKWLTRALCGGWRDGSASATAMSMRWGGGSSCRTRP